MSVGRNDPCPCGSGRKYKRCCLENARKGVPPLPPAAMEVVRQAPVWEMDLVPVPMSRGDGPDSAAVVAMVEADEFVLFADVRTAPGPEPGDVATELEGALTTAAAAVGVLPPAVTVGDREVAARLSALLEPRDVAVDAGPLMGLAVPARDLLTAMGGESGWPPVAARETWAGWGKSQEQVADLHRASADFYRAEPWRGLHGERPIVAAMPGDRSWVMAVLGAGGEEFGLAFYSEMGDFGKLFALEMGELWGAQEGRVYALTFDERDALPRKMQREVAASGWEVASTNAYPMLMVLRSPAGGICQGDWDDVVALLTSVPRFVRSVDTESPELVDWEDPETGIKFLLLPEFGTVPAPAELELGCAEGPGAEPEAALTWNLPEEETGVPERDVADRFTDWLAESGLAVSTVKKHRRNADDFLYFLGQYQSIPVRALHEVDLREFLFDWVHRKSGAPITRIESVPASLTRFFEFLEAREQISVPWARDVLADRELFWIRWRSCPHAPFWTSATREWMAPLTDDLHQRVQLPNEGLGEDDEWGGTMGTVEWDLHAQLWRRWLLWRDDIIRGGVTAPGPVSEELVRRQRAWETEPQEALGGLTPIEAIQEERDSMPIRMPTD